MVAGLEVWDGNGKKTLSLSDRITRYIGKTTVSLNMPNTYPEVSASKSIALPASVAAETISVWVFPEVSLAPKTGRVAALYYKYTFTGNTLTITLHGRASIGSATAECTFLYGVY